MIKLHTRLISATLTVSGLLTPGLQHANAAEASPPKVVAEQREVEAASRARFKALVRRDTSYFQDHYTSDFEALGTDGKLVDIGFLRWIVKNAPTDVKFEPFEYKVIVSADLSQAVAVHKTHDTWDGQHSDVVYTEVFVKSNGHWLLRFEQYAEIQQPGSQKAP